MNKGMKGLLQSKRFKQNLYKWLFMYVGVLLLLATVITYSRYIAGLLGSNEDARSARFHVKVEPIDCNAIDKKCNTGAYLFDDEIHYEFQVDTSELEANADLVVTITADKDFEIIEIKQNNNKIICQNNTDGQTPCNSNIVSSFVDGKTENEEISSEEISSKVNSQTLLTYQIKVKYKKTEEELIESNKYVYDYDKIVNIGYSAIQSELN